jgi:hypothetical protein
MSAASCFLFETSGPDVGGIGGTSRIGGAGVRIAAAAGDE